MHKVYMHKLLFPFLKVYHIHGLKVKKENNHYKQRILQCSRGNNAQSLYAQVAFYISESISHTWAES